MPRKTRRPSPTPDSLPPAPKTTITVRCPRPESFRVQQVAGMFDLTLSPEIVEQFAVEVPSCDEPWQIGCIVGPSGSGKSSVARALFGDRLSTAREWPAGAVVDAFPESLSIREITATLTAVGFSSPPSWLKPYAVLSNGEKFRCDLARALLEQTGDEGRLVVYDEFTSLVDRTVAKVGSAAVAKHIRRSPGLRFVAVTCHYDIVEWLTPDWVLDMQSQQLARGSLRRPPIIVDVFPTTQKSIWDLFKKHHYLNHKIPAAARFFVGCIEGKPASLVVVGNYFGKHCPDRGYADIRHISRIVTLPDYQGIGIGGTLLDVVAAQLARERLQARITTSHPGMIRRLRASPDWRITKFQLGSNQRCMTTAWRRGKAQHLIRGAGMRYLCMAKWIGPAGDGS